MVVVGAGAASGAAPAAATLSFDRARICRQLRSLRRRDSHRDDEDDDDVDVDVDRATATTTTETETKTTTTTVTKTTTTATTTMNLLA